MISPRAQSSERSALRRGMALALTATLLSLPFAIGPVSAAGSGTVDAQVEIARAAACLEISTTAVDFGTLNLGDQNAPGSPDIQITNCGDGLEDLHASGTDATGANATWALVDSAETCADTLGTDRYHLALSTPGGAPIATLSTQNKAVATLSRDETATHTARISTACPGSAGTGAIFNMQINYLVTNTDLILEELTVDQATLDGIAAFALGSADVAVPSNCASSPAIGCPGGVAQNPAGIVHVASNSIVATPAGPGVWNVTAHVGGATLAPITLTYLGASCSLTADTSLGANPDITVTGQLLAKSFPNPGGPTNYVQVANAGVTGLDTADLSIGGPLPCPAASFFLPLMIGQLQATLAAQLEQNICGDPNSDLYIICPPFQ